MKEVGKDNRKFVKCPNCGKDAPVSTYFRQFVITFIVGIVLMSFGMILFLLFPIGIVLTLAGLVGMVIYKFVGGGSVHCKNCNSRFKIKKDEYEEKARALR